MQQNVQTDGYRQKVTGLKKRDKTDLHRAQRKEIPGRSVLSCFMGLLVLVCKSEDLLKQVRRSGQWFLANLCFSASSSSRISVMHHPLVFCLNTTITRSPTSFGQNHFYASKLPPLKKAFRKKCLLMLGLFRSHKGSWMGNLVSTEGLLDFFASKPVQFDRGNLVQKWATDTTKT